MGNIAVPDSCEDIKGIDIGARPLLLLGALLIIVGIQFIGDGMLGEMIVRVYHEKSKETHLHPEKKILGPGK